MTIFEGYVSNPDDLAERVEANALTFDVTEGVAADQETPVPLVLVEASYKPHGACEHPVRLTISDAIRAAAALVSLSHDSLTEASYGDAEPDATSLLDLLKQLTHMDEAVWEFRTWLHAEVEHRLQPVDDEDQADEAEENNEIFWREGPSSPHLNDGLHPFVFRQLDDGSLLLHSVAGDTEHDHVTSDEPRTFEAAASSYGPLVRSDANGRPLDEGQADTAGNEVGQ